MRTIIFFTAFFIGLILSIFIFSVFWIYQIDREWAPLIEPRIKERQEIGSIRIFAEDSNKNKQWLASLTSGRLEERKPVSLSDIPPLLIQSIVVLEDPRFLSHEGFDVIGIFRAAFAVLRTLRFSQGGSTITQQLVKNIFLSHEKTLKRKFTEIVLAALVEKRFSKDEIIEAYVNEIYMGQVGPLEVHGVGRAAEYYFQKSLNDLELHEMALLAALIASPGYYSPWKHPDRALKRRERVLKHLLDHKIILEDEFRQANAQPLPNEAKFLAPTRAYYLVDALREKLLEERSEKDLLKGGFDVLLDLDLDLQKTAESSLQNFSSTYPEIQGAVIAVDPKNCSIKTYVGGSDYRVTQLDRIRQSKRSIGSLIKPFEIAPILEKENEKLNLGSPLEDRPLDWSYDHGRGKWAPQNYDKKNRGMVNLREALEQSLNIPIVRIFFERSPSGDLNEYFEMARALGLDIPPDRTLPSSLLGTIEQKPWDVATAYAKLVRQAMGMSQNAADLDCTLHFEKQLEENKIDNEKIQYSINSSHLVISALEGALRRGTSASLGATITDRQAWAGKTGTSGDKKDSWYVALSPDLVILTWVGRDDNKETPFTGASGALKIAAPLVQLQSKRTQEWQWPIPNAVGWKVYDRDHFCIVGSTIADEFKKAQSINDFPSHLPSPQPFRGRTMYYEKFFDNRYPNECTGE